MNLHQKRPRVPRQHGGGKGGTMPGIHGVATMADTLKAPFPYFGGKRAIASLIWQRLGDPDNFIEPFMGSAAVLLCRPHPPRVETVNDKDVMIANFWRATQFDPEQVAYWADWPVDECCMHANHRWLVLSDDAAAFRQKMRTDPDYYDCKVAGKWVHGLCCWIGGGWAVDPEHGAVHGPVRGSGERRPAEHSGLQGVHARGDGLSQQVPHLAQGSHGGKQQGRGVHGSHEGHRPQLADAYARGRGVHGNDAADRYLSEGTHRPALNHRAGLLQNGAPGGPTDAREGVSKLGNPGTCASRRAWLLDWFCRLRDRLRTVRVCAGHWLRVCDSESVTTRLGLTGLFLDPPYPSHKADGTDSRSDALYATDGDRDALDALRDEVLAYCLERGANPKMRIVVAGYDTDGYAELERHDWEVIAWSAQGGYGNRSKKGKANAKRERLWCSPHCLRGPASLFDQLDAGPDPEEQQCANETS
jgi:hypothetical protein